MKKTLFILLSFAFFTAAEAQHHPRWKKESAQHEIAVRKCNEDFTTAVKAAESLRGQDRKSAIITAKRNRKQCMANALH